MNLLRFEDDPEQRIVAKGPSSESRVDSKLVHGMHNAKIL